MLRLIEMHRSPGLMPTLQSWHIVAEHVLSAARFEATGRIGLIVTDGHVSTPAYGDDARTLAIAGTDLVRSDATGVASSPLTTLRAAGELAGVVPGAPSAVYTPATPCDLDARLTLDARAAAELTDWYALVAEALQKLEVELADEAPSAMTLWPEHFDVAIRVGEVNYGGLGGDSAIPEPYLYVGPTGPVRPTEPAAFWNVPFGAAVTRDRVVDVDAALDFFRAGHAAVTR